jgi:hypothetical protein
MDLAGAHEAQRERDVNISGPEQLVRERPQIR